MDSSGLCCHSFAAGRIICDTAYCGIRDIYAVNILNMCFDIAGRHALAYIDRIFSSMSWLMLV